MTHNSDGSEEEAAGIKAIIALQKMAGIEESVELATKGWRNMSVREQKQTMMAYAMCCRTGVTDNENS